LWAIRKGGEVVITLLLEKGADVESEDNHGWTPLSLAVENGHEAVIKPLLEKGANVKSKDMEGCREGARGDCGVAAQEEQQETSRSKRAEKALSIISYSSRTFICTLDLPSA
jgi:ankyrin repeat protein